MTTPFTILVDTREQRPLCFAEDVVVVRGTLREGDYTTPELQGRVAIERKSLADFLGSLTHDRARFFRELERLKPYDFRAVVVEGSLEQITSRAYRSQVHPNSVIGSVCKLLTDFECPVIFADDRRTAAVLVEKLLRRLQDRFLFAPTALAEEHEPARSELA